jgi:hypothetical protein
MINERYWLRKRALNKGLMDKPKGPWIRHWHLNGKGFFSLFRGKKTQVLGVVSMIVDVVDGR